MTTKLITLLEQLKRAEDLAREELLRLYPIGTDIWFTIMSGQRNASTGQVLGAGWVAGYLRVRHYEAKPNSRYSVRSVHHSQILS